MTVPFRPLNEDSLPTLASMNIQVALVINELWGKVKSHILRVEGGIFKSTQHWLNALLTEAFDVKKGTAKPMLIVFKNLTQRHLKFNLLRILLFPPRF